MGSIFIPLYDYNLKNKEWEKFAWIGPEETLRPEPRRSLSMKSKREVLSRQRNLCRFCKTKITLEPYCTADADHIIPINFGGKTNPENIQLLCVGCHRHKTSLENRHDKIIVYTPKEQMNPGETIIITSQSITSPILSRPMDMRNPLDIKDEGVGSIYILRYNKKRKGMYTDGSEVEESVNIFDRFRYISQ